jgi:hypothetical protein
MDITIQILFDLDSEKIKTDFEVDIDNIEKASLKTEFSFLF